jgi:hypothetical protein
MNPKAELEDRMDRFRHSAVTCAIYGYTYMTLDYRLGGDPDTQDRLSQHNMFWTVTYSAYQYSTIVAIGRVYDPNKKHSAKRLLDFAFGHHALFASDNARARLSTLQGEAQRRESLYADKLKPLRDQVIAHMGDMPEHVRDIHFLLLRKRDMEDLVLFPLRLHRALLALKNGGTGADLENVPTEITEVVCARRDSTYADWKHIEASAATLKFLDWLRSTPLIKGQGAGG